MPDVEAHYMRPDWANSCSPLRFVYLTAEAITPTTQGQHITSNIDYISSDFDNRTCDNLETMRGVTLESTQRLGRIDGVKGLLLPPVLPADQVAADKLPRVAGHSFEIV